MTTRTAQTIARGEVPHLQLNLESCMQAGHLGKSLGRRKGIFDPEKARLLLQSMSVREAARQPGVSRGVVERALLTPASAAAD